MWKKILPYSAWASAVGSLVNAVASKIISDVFDLSGMDVDEAERTAQLITMVCALDDLFIREDPLKNGKDLNKIEASDSDEEDTTIPLTAQFASNWMKMKFLSEVLQANLVDIRYLWFESDLSLYFSKEEIADLIKLSFEDNINSRQLIREIKQSTIPEANTE
jgi:centromere/kinetochore protein ZW10